MRTIEQIEKIRQTLTNPYVSKSFLTSDEIFHLTEIFNQNQNYNSPYSNLIHKNTGPVTLDLKHYQHDTVIVDILERLKNLLGTFEITAAFFFKTDYPHIIHNDDTFELPDNVFKGITLPLYIDGFSGVYPKLCFFDQFYFQGPAKFFNGDQNIPTYYNKQIYEYSNVDNLSSVSFIDQDSLFTHLKPQWLEGLSLNSTLDWIPGDALIFDSVRLHCASDFRKLGIKSKLGISIFTKKC